MCAYETTSGIPPVVVAGDWQIFPPNTYRIMAWMTPETDGGYSVVSINLPGCATQGETLDECLRMLKEAAAGLIECYREIGESIPWVTSGPKPEPPSPDSRRITVFVTVP